MSEPQVSCLVAKAGFLKIVFCFLRSQCRSRFLWIWRQFERNEGEFSIDELPYKDGDGIRFKRQQRVFDNLERRIRIKFKKCTKLQEVDFSDGDGKKTLDSFFNAIDKVLVLSC